MSSRFSLFASSVGAKVLVALTGLALVAYLVLHLAGNLLVFLGPDTFNGYADVLISNPLVVPVEIGLLAVFLVHVVKAIQVTRGNRRARPQPYARKAGAGGASRKSVASTSMIWTGLIVLAFVVLHVRGFKYGPHYDTVVDGRTVRNLYQLEMEAFASLPVVAFYAAAILLVGTHLSHGFLSAFQSLGAGVDRRSRQLQRVGWVLATILAAGFFIIPIWAFLLGSRS